MSREKVRPAKEVKGAAKAARSKQAGKNNDFTPRGSSGVNNNGHNE
jgi:hypothetical protein